MDDRCYWIWLQSALGVQSRLEEAIAYFGTARRLYEAGELEWKLAGLFTARQLEKLRSQRLTQAEEILKQCAGNGWLALTPEDPCYPKRLRAIPNFPAALYVWGRMPDLDGRVALAVVGAREASFQGRQIAQGLCKAFAQAGAVVVSGGALGIDSAAHMGALEGGGE
ncbi:MAG: DNA-processing protein DprA, partial [Acutalibacteraceae bacterium]|nr:DNA-processing protein DprA [Acutalibacteraceae bacterium]